MKLQTLVVVLAVALVATTVATPALAQQGKPMDHGSDRPKPSQQEGHPSDRPGDRPMGPPPGGHEGRGLNRSEEHPRGPPPCDERPCEPKGRPCADGANASADCPRGPPPCPEGVTPERAHGRCVGPEARGPKPVCGPAPANATEPAPKCRPAPCEAPPMDGNATTDGNGTGSAPGPCPPPRCPPEQPCGPPPCPHGRTPPEQVRNGTRRAPDGKPGNCSPEKLKELCDDPEAVAANETERCAKVRRAHERGIVQRRGDHHRGEAVQALEHRVTRLERVESFLRAELAAGNLSAEEAAGIEAVIARINAQQDRMLDLIDKLSPDVPAEDVTGGNTTDVPDGTGVTAPAGNETAEAAA